MALTGHLSDLSLSELIEFFCNQRKTGCLNVRYPEGSGCFYLQSGSVVHAKIGMLRGIDAVYYALTLPNAAFEFKGAAEIPERSINQPWTQVVLEGLRRLDEGITPAEAFPDGPIANDSDDMAAIDRDDASPSNHSASRVPSFLSSMTPSSLSAALRQAMVGRKEVRPRLNVDAMRNSSIAFSYNCISSRSADRQTCHARCHSRGIALAGPATTP